MIHQARTCTPWLMLAVICAAGCGGLSKPYPEKNLYAINVNDPPASSHPAIDAVVRINFVRVAEPFDATTFYYKLDDSKFTADYYNGFVAPPARLLTGSLVSYLEKSGVYSSVVGGSSSADNRYALEANVTALYGDYAPGQQKQAIIEARFFLIDEASGDYNVVFEKSYRQTQQLSSDAPGELANAFGEAYEQLLAALVTDLGQASLKVSDSHTSGTP